MVGDDHCCLYDAHMSSLTSGDDHYTATDG